MNKKILEVKNLTTRFSLIKQTITAVDDISFDLYEDEILAIVGESGCGKSVTLLSILNLIDKPGKIENQSQVLFQGKNLIHLTEQQIARVRGNDIAIIFQEPASAFNPLFKIGYQIDEALKKHKQLPASQNKKYRREYITSVLSDVHIPEPEQRLDDYPFQLSGGMLQRAMIALAICCSPKILLADEPTTALDVTIQHQVMNLIREKAKSEKMAVIFVTHDLELISNFAHRILIMYAGRIMEICFAEQIQNVLHPYTQDLLKAIPQMGSFKQEKQLFTIKGNVPELSKLPPGCKYAPRCSKSFKKCHETEPQLLKAQNSIVRCWLYLKSEKRGIEDEDSH